MNHIKNQPYDLSTAQEWKKAVLDYAAAINQFVDMIQDESVENCDDLSEPEMAPTEHLVIPWFQALIAVNQLGMTEAQRLAFRNDWPPARSPLSSFFNENNVKIPTLIFLDDDSVLARISPRYKQGHVVHIAGNNVRPMLDVEFFGRCPSRRYIALSNKEEIIVTDGWQGPQVAKMSWPTGLEDLPHAFKVSYLKEQRAPTQLIPFPDGQRVLFVSIAGIFVLTEEGATRLFPTKEGILENLAEADIESKDDLPTLDMEHAAISADGHWIAVGSQFSLHEVYDAELRLVAKMGPPCDYPHFAMFNSRSDMAIFNACHFYQGITFGVTVENLQGLQTGFGEYVDDTRTPILQSGARVYAGVHRKDEFIIGDARGYLKAFSETGEVRWQHYIGTTISAIDISNDGKFLVVSTFAGIVCFIELDAGRTEAWQIGTGNHLELRRWLFLKDIDRPMMW